MFISVTIFAILALTTFPQCNARPLSEVDPDELVITTVNNASVCRVSGKQYLDGEKIETGEPCETCICRPPGFACNLIKCSSPEPPKDPKGCQLLKPPNACCQAYVCLPQSAEEPAGPKTDQDKVSVSNTPKPPPVEINEINGTPAPEVQFRSGEEATVAPHSSEEGAESSEEAGLTVPPLPDARKEDEETRYVIIEEATVLPSPDKAANASARSEDEESVANSTDDGIRARADEVLILLDDQDQTLNATKEVRSNEAASNETEPLENEDRSARASDNLAITTAATNEIAKTTQGQQAEEGTVRPPIVTLPIFITDKEPQQRADESQETNSTSSPNQGDIATRRKRGVGESFEESEQSPEKDITIKEFVVLVPEKDSLEISAEEKDEEVVPVEQNKEILQGSEENQKDKEVVPIEQETKEVLQGTEQGQEKEVVPFEETKEVLHVSDQEKDKEVPVEETKEVLNVSDQEKEVVPAEEQTKEVLLTSEQGKEKEVVSFEETKDVLHISNEEKEKDVVVPVEEENKKVLQTSEPNTEIKEVLKPSEPKEEVVIPVEETKEILQVSDQEKNKEVHGEETKDVLQTSEAKEETKEVLQPSESKEEVVIPAKETKEILQVSDKEKNKEVPVEETKEVLEIANVDKEKDKEVVVGEQTKEVLEARATETETESVKPAEENKNVFVSEQEKEVIPEDKKEVLAEQPVVIPLRIDDEHITDKKKDVFYISETEIKAVEAKEPIQDEKKDTLASGTEANADHIIPEQEKDILLPDTKPEEDKYVIIPESKPVVVTEDKVEKSTAEHDNFNVQEKEAEIKQEVVPAVDEVNIGLPEAEIKNEKKSPEQEEQVSVVKLERKKRSEEGKIEEQTVQSVPKEDNEAEEATVAAVEAEEKVIVKNDVQPDKTRRRRKRRDAEEVPVPPQQVLGITPTIKSLDTTTATQSVQDKEAQTQPSPTLE